MLCFSLYHLLPDTTWCTLSRRSISTPATASPYQSARSGCTTASSSRIIAIFAQVVFVIAPFGAHFYKQLQVYFSLQKLFYSLSGADTQFFYEGTLLTYQYDLLRLSAHDDLRLDDVQRFLFFKRLDDDRRMVWYLFVVEIVYLLAYQLADEETYRPVRNTIFRVE